MRAVPASGFVLLVVLAGCRPGLSGSQECFRLDTRPASPDSAAATAFLAFRGPAVLEPSGDSVLEGTWEATPPVLGVRRGTARLRRSRDGGVGVDLVPMPVSGGTALAGAPVRGGSGAAGPWAGSWVAYYDAPYSLGTFELARLPAGAPCRPATR